MVTELTSGDSQIVLGGAIVVQEREEAIIADINELCQESNATSSKVRNGRFWGGYRSWRKEKVRGRFLKHLPLNRASAYLVVTAGDVGDLHVVSRRAKL